MQVRQLPVLNPFLQPYIDYYYILSTEADTRPATYLAFPSNNVPVCFFRNCRISLYPQKAIVKKQDAGKLSAIIVGNAVHPVSVCMGPGIKEFCIVFKPPGLNCMVDKKLGTTLSATFSATNLFPECRENIELILDGQENLEALERQLVARVHLSPELRSLQQVIAILEKKEEPQSFGTIAGEIFISYKTIYRLFKAHLGTSPVQFRHLVKFRQAVNNTKKKSYTRKMTKMALDSGYYDQSNLVNEFKKIAGHTPANFIKAVTLVADKRIAWKFE